MLLCLLFLFLFFSFFSFLVDLDLALDLAFVLDLALDFSLACAGSLLSEVSPARQITVIMFLEYSKLSGASTQRGFLL